MSVTRPGSIACRLFASAALAVAARAVEAAGVPTSCTGEAYRAFDFWLGEWRVTAGGVFAGDNRIERILGGCALLETWRGAKGGQGRSLNAYDATRGVWHQTWVDGRGEVLILEGGWRDGAMRLEGTQRTVSGASVRARITWTPNADRSVRQLWETSADDGRTWRIEFDGRYERAS